MQRVDLIGGQKKCQKKQPEREKRMIYLFVKEKVCNSNLVKRVKVFSQNCFRRFFSWTPVIGDGKRPRRPTSQAVFVPVRDCFQFSM